jgi:hypothetical protein
MSSVVRYVQNNSAGLQPTGVVVPTYGANKVVPFILDKQTGILDFDFSTGFAVNTNINGTNTVYIAGQSFNSLRNVTDIGPNIKAWCESRASADVGSVTIYEKPIVVRANQIAYPREPNSDNSMTESNDPISFENASGDDTTDYYSTYLFKKPLIVTYTVSGIRRYRMFNTHFSPQT